MFTALELNIVHWQIHHFSTLWSMFILFAFQYVLEELNVRSLAPCNDTLKYASLCAEPDFRYVNCYFLEHAVNYCFMLPISLIWLLSCSVLGKRLGRSIKDVANKIKAMSQEDILAFERTGEVTIATHCLKQTDIKVIILWLPCLYG